MFKIDPKNGTVSRRTEPLPEINHENVVNLRVRVGLIAELSPKEAKTWCSQAAGVSYSTWAEDWESGVGRRANNLPTHTVWAMLHNKIEFLEWQILSEAS